MRETTLGSLRELYAENAELRLGRHLDVWAEREGIEIDGLEQFLFDRAKAFTVIKEELGVTDEVEHMMTALLIVFVSGWEACRAANA